MIPSFTFDFEIAMAILVVIWVLCAKPEYGLFLYGLALGFPDFAIPVGTAVNIRLDDGLILLFLIRSVVWTPTPLATGQRKILGWQAILFAVCACSATFQFATGIPPAAYDTIKMIGCGAILVALPRLVQSERRLRFLVAGLACGGIALAIQISSHLDGSSASAAANFQEFKNAGAFATWNPNTIGQAGMLAVFAAGVGWIVFARTRTARFFWVCLAAGFALIPALLFVRGTSLSIAAGLVLFLLLSGKWKWVLLLLIVSGVGVLYLRTENRGLAESAFRVDLTTGEGLSHRYDRWEIAIDAIRAKPFLGEGFGREWAYLQDAGSEGRAHNAYLSVWIELGLGGLAVLLAVITQFVSVGVSLYRKPQFKFCGALILALIVAACIDSIGLPTLYWEKLPTISLAIAVALAGICERKQLVGERSDA